MIGGRGTGAGIARQGVTKFLVDTNVWLDHFLARTERHGEVSAFLGRAHCSETAALYVASLSIKDVAFLLERTMKSYARADGRPLSEDVAAAARETAWGCVRSMVALAMIVPVGFDEVMRACTYKGVHDDFEDDLILGAATRAGVDYILTHDQTFAKRAPVPCIDVGQAAQLLN